MSKIETAGLYQYLQEKEMPGLKENVKKISVKKGKSLYDTTHTTTDIYEVVNGAVKLGGLSVKGEEYIYEIITAGEFFGNLDVLSAGDVFSEFARSLIATELITYKPAFFQYLMNNDLAVANWCIKRTVYRWHKTESLLANIRSYEPRERIVMLYNSLSNRMINIDQRLISLAKLVTNKDIADLTATTRQLVAGTLAK